MSADNWRTCPKCELMDKTDVAKVFEKAKQSYGKVSADEYTRLVDEAIRVNESKKKLREETMREDYEIGVGGDAKFYVDYRCSCSTCGFVFNYKVEKSLKL